MIFGYPRAFFLDLVMAAVDLRMLLVSQMYVSMHGLGTDEKALSRIFILRSDVSQMASIQFVGYKMCS